MDGFEAPKTQEEIATLMRNITHFIEHEEAPDLEAVSAIVWLVRLVKWNEEAVKTGKMFLDGQNGMPQELKNMNRNWYIKNAMPQIVLMDNLEKALIGRLSAHILDMTLEDLTNGPPKN